MASVRQKNKAYEILRGYQGGNPFILMLKKQVYVDGDIDAVKDFQTEYILDNYDKAPRTINKVVRITKECGENKQKKWGTEFVPEKIKIITLLGETKTVYHCMVQYRKSVEPVMCFLKKRDVITNFFVEDYHNVEVDFDRYDKLMALKKPDRKMMEHQKEGVQFLLSRKKCILADDQGLGKMEPVTSLIPTPNGFKKMGEIEVGDKVFGSDGKICNVLKTFPHKGKEIYRVEFSDGTFIDCGMEHLWKVRDINMRSRNKGWCVKSLKEILDSGLQYNDKTRIKTGVKQRNKWEVPLTESVEYAQRDFLIHPYILGMCIGDGNLCNGTIAISIPDNEKEDAERIKTFLKNGYILREDRSTNCPRYRIIEEHRSVRNPYIQEIKRLSLNVKGNDKFIPDEYKFSSVEQRIDLLRGLMDSDGTIANVNKISYSTTSEKLADDVVELVYSLGGKAKKHTYDRRKSGKNIEYIVSINVKFNPFYLSRKANKFQVHKERNKCKYIVSVKYDRIEDAKCLLVDSYDNTYLTGKNYTVTHNTMTLSVAAIEGNFDSVVIICPASLKINWKEELLWFVPEKDITIIEGALDKTKEELEKSLGYGVGKSGKKKDELIEEFKERGKWVDNRFVIVNYDILDEFYKIPKSWAPKSVEEAYNQSPLLQYIKNKKSLLIIDEAHNLSKSSSIRYKVIRDLIKRGEPHSIYLATGTPITNNPQNLFYILQLINDPSVADYKYYAEQYCGATTFLAKGEWKRCTDLYLESVGKTMWAQLTDKQKAECSKFIDESGKHITVAKEATNLDELKERIAPIYLRREKDDFNDMPEKTIHEVFYDLTKEQKKKYDKLWEEYEEAQLDADPEKELNKDLLEGSIYRSFLSEEMVPYTISLANRLIKEGEKVVIACCYDKELYELQEYYKDKCVIFNGKINAKQKDNAVKEFMNNPEVKVFIGNIKSCGVGLTLISSCNLIFNNMEFVYASNAQMQDRVHRIGQKRDVHIYYQIFRDTQYETMWNIVLRKQTIFNSVIKKESDK